jgi:hypothetical protein
MVPVFDGIPKSVRTVLETRAAHPHLSSAQKKPLRNKIFAQLFG